jgi:hypothetical protein
MDYLLRADQSTLLNQLQHIAPGLQQTLAFGAPPV